MDTVEREDTILTLMRVYERSGHGSKADDLADQTRVPVQKIMNILDELVLMDNVLETGDGIYTLTDQGYTLAATVMRRHHVLETFLKEMLGMDHETAHEEACTMEHHTSENTINRLRSFLKTTRECPGPCRIHHRHHSCRTLTDCPPGEDLVIEAIRGCRRELRLADLGLVPGEHIRVMERMADTLLIRVKDCDIAISPEIARSVLVGVDR